jgi:hypothetical protein
MYISACHKKIIAVCIAALFGGWRQDGGGVAAGRWQGRCQGVGVGASVWWWQSGIGGGEAFSVALVPPPTLMLCSVCIAWLGSRHSAHFAQLTSGSLAYAAHLRPRANIKGGAAVLGSLPWLESGLGR